MAVVVASLRMMPRLEAEESLQAVVVAAMGGGLLAKDDAARIRVAWETAANGGRRRALKPTPDDLRAAGIGVRVVPAPLKAPEAHV